VELLDARLVEEVRERIARRVAQELEPALVADAQRLLLGQRLRDVADARPRRLLLLVDGDVRVLAREAAERRLGACHLLARLAELLTEELLRGDVGRPAR